MRRRVVFMGRFIDAAGDATLSLFVQPESIKNEKEQIYCLKKENQQEAISEYQEVLKIDPNNPAAQAGLQKASQIQHNA
jgi:hypothetical protein